MSLNFSEPVAAGPHSGPLDIAVIGSGIAGLSAAWLLSQHHHVTLYEADDRLGGHSNTAFVPSPTGPLGIDTGFIVYNEQTYPNLTALFRHLDVRTEASDMSFAVSKDEGGFEYAGRDLPGLFAQPRNILRPRFWSMLRDLLRFYREAPADIAMVERETMSLGAYLDLRRYSAAFRDDHLLPMASAIWSTPTDGVAHYPAGAFLRFCVNHGLLQIARRPIWRTVSGGSSSYVFKLVSGMSGRICLNRPIRSVERLGKRVRLRDMSGETVEHDQVVIATHAHQALAMLGDADELERDLLGAFRSTKNLAVLHTDSSLMPKRRRAWSSWNFIEAEQDGAVSPYLTYWMNRLQNLPPRKDYFVSINPPRPPKMGSMVQTETYAHPLFDARSLAAQRRLWDIQGRSGVWFCGAWFGAGFHEDGLQAGLAVAEALGSVRRPWTVAEESGRIFLPTGGLAQSTPQPLAA
ncbi:FAD-dependent oxidoreductase [Acidisoma cellulosilytica]|uniref:FAD-dependent oxidoreductase n=1 Tax=Acidisoma cellulosilyticum TaxID=2802395 RepID=A0A964E3K5_9PROT|nr:FAD-dependent oxidoreductase [Acidisoma cellulosilyticum]MCB8880038.1 FAD-dependent oxidoreductase [Acidisoma cellulosilyticum]